MRVPPYVGVDGVPENSGHRAMLAAWGEVECGVHEVLCGCGRIVVEMRLRCARCVMDTSLLLCGCAFAVARELAGSVSAR